jgi:hypothetical protein
MKKEIKRNDYPDTPEGQHSFEMNVHSNEMASRETKADFYNHLRGIIEYILSQPAKDRSDLEREIIDNINQLHYNNNY